MGGAALSICPAGRLPTVPVDEIESKLGEHLHPLIASLFERFGVAGLTPDRVTAELNRMKTNRFGSVGS